MFFTHIVIDTNVASFKYTPKVFNGVNMELNSPMVHLIYKYRSDKVTIYDDMCIEIQTRTLMQHAWATTVEIVGKFIKQSLK